MKTVVIVIDDYLYEFYKKVGENAGRVEPEKVMADALRRLAGELSLNALHIKNKKDKFQ